MTVKLKMKVKTEDQHTKLNETPESIEEKVDKLANLADDIKALEVKITKIAAQELKTLDVLKKRKSDVEKELLAYAEEKLEPEDKITINGTAGDYVEIGAKALKRTIIDIEKVLEYMGDEAFIAAASIPLGVIDDHLTKKQRDEVLESTRDGKRSLSLKKISE